ncbi:MAG: hypothetical protein F6J93_40760 [Oscillatoria sp. SIO1A7]|nr:hypothetical protein [Oscillatoria sp. SIO1A7]
MPNAQESSQLSALSSQQEAVMLKAEERSLRAPPISCWLFCPMPNAQESSQLSALSSQQEAVMLKAES